MSKRRVVVTGIGSLTPIGNSASETWSAALAGKNGVDKISIFDASNHSCQIAAEVKNFNPEDHIPKKDIKRYDKYSVFAIVSAREAWSNAGLVDNTLNPSRLGCIFGVGIGGLSTLEENHIALLEGGPRKVSPFVIPGMISNLGPGNIAIDLNLQGVNYTVTSACTSGTHAVGESFRMIRDGLQDVVLTGGSEAAITPLAVAGFARMKALSTRNDDPKTASRPFDKGRDGFVMGEGGASLVLEELEHAKSRGAKIYAEVVGYGFSCDAYHITSPREGGDGAVACMTSALKSAGVGIEQIGYINAHGTSTPINDPAETKAIKTVFGEQAKKLLISSTKSMTGHLLGAAGGVEAMFLAKVLETGMVPPTINLQEPDQECDLDYVANTAREASVEYAMSNSFGFGGTNASILFKRYNQ